MEKIECRPRKWGNSLGIAIPKEIVEREGISPGKPITITLNSRPDLKGLFGSLRFSRTAQQMKDEEREGWQD